MLLLSKIPRVTGCGQVLKTVFLSGLDVLVDPAAAIFRVGAGGKMLMSPYRLAVFGTLFPLSLF